VDLAAPACFGGDFDVIIAQLRNIGVDTVAIKAFNGEW
jgi:hypothetical protein